MLDEIKSVSTIPFIHNAKGIVERCWLGMDVMLHDFHRFKWLEVWLCLMQAIRAQVISLITTFHIKKGSNRHLSHSYRLHFSHEISNSIFLLLHVFAASSFQKISHLKSFNKWISRFDWVEEHKMHMIWSKNISFVYLAQNHCENIQVAFSIINVHTQMCQNNFPKGNVESIKSYCFSPKGNVEFEQ